MDLTSGITQMQSQLKPDVFAGYQQGANAYATAEKQGQEIASNRIKNENAKREQEIQIRLQKAIEESFDPATGQPDYDKLAANGHKYGITAQQMDYTIKHLKENWSSLTEIAKNKRDLELYNKKGSSDIHKAATGATGWKDESTKTPTIQSTAKGTAPVISNREADQTGSSAGESTQLPQNELLTEPQKALTGASNDNIKVANGMIGGLNAAVESGANPTSAPIPTQTRGGVAYDPITDKPVGWVGDSTTKPVAPVTSNGSDASKPMDLGQTTLTANAETAQAPHTLYGVANAIEAEPFPTPGATRVPQYSEDSVKSMSGDWKAEIVRGLRNSGIQLPADAQITDKMISDGINTVTGNAVSSLYKGYNPYDPQKAIGSLYEAEALAPETAQKAFQDLLAKGREIKSTRLGQTATSQSTAQSKTDFDQTQAAVNDAHSSGYTLVTKADLPKYTEAKGKINQLENTRKEIETLKEESHKLSDDAFNAKFNAMLVGPKSAEGINTESATSEFMSAIRRDKSLGQVIGEAKSLQDLAGLITKNTFSAQSRKTLLKIMDGVVESQMKTGVAKSVLDSYKPHWSKEKASKTGASGKKPEDTPTKKYKDNGDILIKNPNGAGFTKAGSWK